MQFKTIHFPALLSPGLSNSSSKVKAIDKKYQWPFINCTFRIFHSIGSSAFFCLYSKKALNTPIKNAKGVRNIQKVLSELSRSLFIRLNIPIMTTSKGMISLVCLNSFIENILDFLQYFNNHGTCSAASVADAGSAYAGIVLLQYIY